MEGIVGRLHEFETRFGDRFHPVPLLEKVASNGGNLLRHMQDRRARDDPQSRGRTHPGGRGGRVGVRRVADRHVEDEPGAGGGARGGRVGRAIRRTRRPGLPRICCSGTLRMDMLEPFPRQSDEDQAVGDEHGRRRSARSCARTSIRKRSTETRTIPEEGREGAQALGVFRMKVPKEYGGLGFCQVNYNRVMMAIASYCGSTAVLISAHQSIGVPQPLKMFGRRSRRRGYLPRIAEGETVRLCADGAGCRLRSGADGDDRDADRGRRATTSSTARSSGRTNGPIADAAGGDGADRAEDRRGKERAADHGVHRRGGVARRRGGAPLRLHGARRASRTGSCGSPTCACRRRTVLWRRGAGAQARAAARSTRGG